MLGMLNRRVVVPRATAEDLLVDSLSVAYDGPQVLHDVTLDVAAGEMVALLGPSGCGKTTLLRTIAGLERQMSGTVRLGERVLGDGHYFVPPEKRRIGMVFQDGALFPHLNVGQNVAYGLPRAKRRSTRVTETLELVGLDGMEDRRPGSLSGGQQQRVALARALAPHPGVLLLDEPSLGLAPLIVKQIFGIIERINREYNTTIFLVEQNANLALKVAARGYVMETGRITLSDSAASLLSNDSVREAYLGL